MRGHVFWQAVKAALGIGPHPVSMTSPEARLHLAWAAVIGCNMPNCPWCDK